MPLFKKKSTTEEKNRPQSETSRADSEEEALFQTMQLEAFAEELEERLTKSKMIKNRQQDQKRITKSFTGQDAVTVLREILQDESCGVPATRDQALQVGREIDTEFQFFAPARPWRAFRHG